MASYSVSVDHTVQIGSGTSDTKDHLETQADSVDITQELTPQPSYVSVAQSVDVLSQFDQDGYGQIAHVVSVLSEIVPIQRHLYLDQFVNISQVVTGTHTPAAVLVESFTVELLPATVIVSIERTVTLSISVISAWNAYVTTPQSVYQYRKPK